MTATRLVGGQWCWGRRPHFPLWRAKNSCWNR